MICTKSFFQVICSVLLSSMDFSVSGEPSALKNQVLENNFSHFLTKCPLFFLLDALGTCVVFEENAEHGR